MAKNRLFECGTGFFRIAVFAVGIMVFAGIAHAESVSGTILDKNGNGVEAVGVVYKNEKDLSRERTASDESGFYNFPSITAGLCKVRVEPFVDTGYAQKEKYAYFTAGETRTGFNFNLREGALIEGLLTVAGDGTHPHNILIDAIGGHLDKGGAISDNGNYAVRLVPGSHYIGINGGSPEYITLSQSLTVNDINDNEGIDITLYRVPDDCVTVQGNVSINAAPHQNSSIAMITAAAGTVAALGPGNTTFMSVSEFNSEAVSGSYSMPLVPDHNYDVGFGLWNRSSEGIVSFTLIGVAEDVAADNSSFEGSAFSFDNAGGEISGKVTDTEGNPVLMAEVSVFNSSNGRYAAFANTDQNGDYHIYNVPMGEYTAYADHSDYRLTQYQQGVTVTEGAVASGVNIIFGGKGLILWNKLGSDDEVAHGQVGPNGEIVGSINFEPGQFGSGFRSAPRTGDPNIPANYILFRNLNLGHQGCIELWYHPDWNSPAVGHVVNLFTYGKPEDSFGSVFAAGFNDWQNRWSVAVYDYGYQQCVAKYLVPSQTSGWSTTKPFHLAYVWDDSLSDPSQRVKIFLNGVDAGLLNTFYPNNPKFDNWGADFVLYLGCRMISGDWYRHHWEPNIDGVIDNIKIWNYYKTDFSDRFTEDGSPNIAPIAENSSISLDEDTSVDITLSAADPNIGQELNYEIVDQPAHGVLGVLNGSSVTYTPGQNYNGSDSFAYKANDGQADSNAATVSIAVIAVNDPPVFDPIDNKEIKEWELLAFTVNAADIDGDSLLYEAHNLPAGAGFNAASRLFEWTPTPAQAGVYMVQFEVNDGSVSVFKDVTIVVTNVTPDELINGLIGYIDGLDIDNGVKNSLTVKLENAKKSLEKGGKNAAINKVQAFINEIGAQRGKKLTNAQADKLILEVQKIIIFIQQG